VTLIQAAYQEIEQLHQDQPGRALQHLREAVAESEEKLQQSLAAEREAKG
jgi:hypothetical protein